MGLKRLFTRQGKRQWLVFLFCIGIALLLWLLHKLSMEYAAYFRYEVSIVSDMDGYASDSQNEEAVLIKGRASGFYILKHQWGRVPQLRLQVPERDLRPSGREDSFMIAASALNAPLLEQLGGDLVLESLLLDSIHVSFTKVASKRCKVAFQGVYSFDPQYTSFRPLLLTPDSVTVTGPVSVLERIDSVQTQAVQLRELYKDMQGMVGLLPIAGVHYSVRDVRYEIFVSRFAAYSVQREVKVENLPAGVSVLLVPTTVNLQFRAPYDIADPLFSGYFELFVDYNDIAQSLSGKMIPQHRALPEYIQRISLDPPLVECIISKF
jgi:YbbR-like protein.